MIKESYCRLNDHEENYTHDKVDPKIQEIRRIQSLASCKPFRSKGHESSIKFRGRENNDPVVPCRIVLGHLIEHEAAKRSNPQYG